MLHILLLINNEHEIRKFIHLPNHSNDTWEISTEIIYLRDRVYLVGSAIAAITNTWWLGVIDSGSSRTLSDSGNKKYEVYEKLKTVEEINQEIIEKLKIQNINVKGEDYG